MKFLKPLKQIDLFATQVQTFLTSRDKTLDKKSFSETHGSIFGGIISILFVSVSTWYSVTLYQNMVNQSQDNITAISSNVDFED